MHPRLSLKNITKRYPGIVANDGINMDIAPGEVLAVLGENGAGKSTLMKIIYGSVRPDEGSLEFDGRPLDVSSPAEARASGIAMVHQHFALFDTLTVAENVALGLPPGRSTAEISEEVKTLGEKYGLEVDPAAVVYELSMGERQRVEIIRALMTNPKLLILDEPTSVLVPQAVRKLFVTLHRLAEEGVSILFISHKLDEIRELADRCVVLRAGRIVSSVNPKAETEASLARLMIGAEPPAIREASGTPGEVVFEMKDVSYPGSLRVCGIENVSVAVRKGEIVGVAGISGNGQARLMAVAAGEAPVADEGVMLFGKPVGSKECTEGQIFIEPQGMCVMAGIGKESGQAAQALASVEERLDTKYGVVLLQPAYTSYQLNLGEISSYPPGYKENAGIFCHNNPWISCAEATLGHGDRAFAVYRKTCPAYIEDISEIHRTEPYVYSQMVAGKDAPTFGEAKNSWLTGTAAWTFFNISQYILGIQPTLDGLKVDPCIPHTLSGFTVTRRFRGAVYHITVDNAAGVQHGIKAVTVDGKAISGNVLPLAAAGAEVTVQVTMG